MGTVRAAHDLELLVRSRHGLIVVDSDEADRVAKALSGATERLGLPLFEWSLTRGLRRAGGAPVYNSTEPVQALAHVESSPIEAVYHFQGLAPHLQDRQVAARLVDVARLYAQRDGAVVLSGTDVALGAPLRLLAATLSLPAPRPEEYRAIVVGLARDLAARGRLDVELTAQEMERLVAALAGLTLQEAERVLTRVMIEDGRLSQEDIAAVAQAKAAALGRDALLDYRAPDERLDDVAGLGGLKRWLASRRAVLADPARAREYGLPFPRGVLLIGVPGCGKSLSAKAVAAEWQMPLLKLDAAGLYDRYVGETEKNFRRALQTAERLAPVVLWIDEIEKAFATGGGEQDGGLSTRVLGSFLSWMQERAGDVFIVATANDISRLPPELLRKGRFDEIFFVDLPDAAARQEALRIHLTRRRQDPTRFALAALAGRADGFSGAELEQAVVSGLYTAFAAGAPLTDAVLLDEIAATRPLSRTMAERITALREWARDRTVSAS